MVLREEVQELMMAVEVIQSVQEIASQAVRHQKFGPEVLNYE